MVNVMEEVSHIQKNGTNDFHKYQYATAADVLQKVNEALCKTNLLSEEGRIVIGAVLQKVNEALCKNKICINKSSSTHL